MSECVNLRDRFGKTYRISFDPAYDPKHVPRDKLDPWMMQIPCECGVIFPHGDDVLAVEVTYAMAKRLDALGLRLHQDGDIERTYLFPVSRFDEVAAIVKPRRRRKLSPEHREKLVAAGTAALARIRHGTNTQSVVATRKRAKSA